MAGELDKQFVDNYTLADAAAFNQLINKSSTNLVRNSSFETWADDGFVAGDSPSCWEYTEGHASDALSRDAVDASAPGHGKYVAKVIKVNSGTAKLEQDLDSYVSQAEALESEWYTVIGSGYSSTASKVRFFVNDGNSNQYTGYLTTSWGRQYEAIQLNASLADSLTVGVEFLAGAYTSQVDDIMLVRGKLPEYYSPNPVDMTVVCTDWDKDSGVAGDIHPVLGGLRIVPFEATGTTGTAATYNLVYSIPADQRPEYILVAHTEVDSIATIDIGDVHAKPSALATTGFDIRLKSIDGTNFQSEAFVVRGFWIGIGYTDNTKAFGAY